VPAAGSLAAEAAAQVQAIVAAAERQADARLADAAHGLLERIDALSADVEALRARAAGVAEQLDALRADIAALGRAEVPAAVAPEPQPAPVESAPAPNGARSSDEAGARLVALNMALEGSPRDATARYLDEQFELPDVQALLDDVYASAGK
jgi:hypothetical protein